MNNGLGSAYQTGLNRGQFDQLADSAGIDDRSLKGQGCSSLSADTVLAIMGEQLKQNISLFPINDFSRRVARPAAATATGESKAKVADRG
jgi:hypothetical protein